MNNAIDVSPLIRGLLAIIGIAVAFGQYPKLEQWAREQAAESFAWKQGLPHFFGDGQHRAKPRRHTHAQGVPPIRTPASESAHL